MVKQRPCTDGTKATDCGLCTIAMLTDLPYEKILADIPNYRAVNDHHWMHYLNLLGFEVKQVDENGSTDGITTLLRCNGCAEWGDHSARGGC